MSRKKEKQGRGKLEPMQDSSSVMSSSDATEKTRKAGTADSSKYKNA